MSDTIKTKRLGDITVTPTMTNKDQFIIIINGQEFLISKENLQKVFTGLSSDEYNKITRLDITGSGNKLLSDAGIYIDMMTKFDQNQFGRVDITKPIEIKGYHIHKNQTDILDKFTVDENGALYFNGEFISSYTLPIASKDNLGGIKVDGTTITIDENGTIHGANTYILPTASDTVLGGVKVDNDTIKVNEGVISADVIGNWSAGTSYPVGYFVVYDNKLYECTSANSDASWNGEHWQPIGSSSSGTTINNWSASTDYVVGDLVINGTTLYQCNTEHISGETFDEIESANWTALSGEKGDKGYSPVASVTQTDTGCTVTVTDASGTTIANLTNGANGKDGASPTIDPTTKNWIVGTVDTGVKAEAQSNYFYTGTEFPTSDLIDGDLYLSFAESTRGNVYQYQELTLDWSLQGNLYGGGAVIDDTSTTGNTVTWSASKINSILGDINTVLASVTGGIT